MPAPKKNDFWKSRSKHGRDKLFKTPDDLLQSAVDYFQWCDDNPWNKIDYKGSDVKMVKIPTQRPYSLSGWRHFIGASETWLVEFKKHCDEDFLRVISEVEQYIRMQQWEGSTVGAFNANIIARTLGLKEQNDHTTNNKEITSITREIVKPKD